MTPSSSRREFLGLAAAAAATGWVAPRILAAGATAAEVQAKKAAGLAAIEGTPPPAYHHAYHQCLVYKIFNADKANPDQGLISFEETLRIIRVLHDLTGGLKQIVYLTGWQFDGHDSKYPAWSEVNHRLKRPADPDARASFLWLAAEARKLNAFVSVHINMSDAYESSPLWKDYLSKGLIVCNKDGAPVKGAVWGGEVSYQVNKVREWESGYARKRIDALLALLPFLRESATVHIDAFGMIGRNEKLRAAVYGIFDYWRAQGVDVTNEYFDPELAGRVPMVYHLNLAEENRLKYPPNVVCGGGDACNMRDPDNRIPYPGWALMPDAGCRYEEAWGVSIDRDLRTSRGGLKGMVGKLCTKTLVWYFLNRHRALACTQDAETYKVMFSDDVETTVRKADRRLTLRQGRRTLVDGGDVFMPALWTAGEWFAYSRDGGKRAWPLPDAWQGAKTLRATPLTDSGRGEPFTLSVADGKVILDLKPGEAVAFCQSV